MKFLYNVTDVRLQKLVEIYFTFKRYIKLKSGFMYKISKRLEIN